MNIKLPTSPRLTPGGNEDTMTLGEAAAHLGIRPNTLSAWINSGRVRLYNHNNSPNGPKCFKRKEVERVAWEYAEYIDKYKENAKRRAKALAPKTDALPQQQEADAPMKLITCEEACALLGISRSSFTLWLRRGYITLSIYGTSRRLYDDREVRALIPYVTERRKRYVPGQPIDMTDAPAR